MSESGPDTDTLKPPKGGRTRRLVGWILIAIGGAAAFLLLGVPLGAEAPAPDCQSVDGVLRGVYHVHPYGHDDTDRSSRVVAAANQMCLDFVIVTNHAAADSEILEMDPETLGFVRLDGAEWTMEPSGHHHGQLVDAYELTGASDAQRTFRVLNHPVSSGIESSADLTEEELALIERGSMAIEVRNAPRLFRMAPSLEARVLAILAGPTHSKQLFGALSLPVPAQALWVELQRSFERSIPLVCGTDAHGGRTDYIDLFPAAVMHVPAPPDGEASAGWVVDQIAADRTVCVVEAMGSPGRLTLSRTEPGCGLQIEAALDGVGHWRLMRDGQEIERGSASTEIRAARPGVYHLEVWRDVAFGVFGSRERLWAVTGGPYLDSKCGDVE